MSRSKVGFLAGLALAAIVATPSVSQAQVSCNIQPGSSSPCTAAMTGSITVPTLARISVTGDSLSSSTLTLTSPVWATFLATPTLTYTLSQAALVVRSNTSYDVSLTGGSWSQPGGAGRVTGDITYEAVSGACGDPSGGYAGTLGAITSIFTGTATASDTRNLCLALEFPGSLASTKLLPGAYTIPITLTLTAP